MTSMRRFKIGKLVRDKFPEVIERKGGQAATKYLSPQDIVHHLKLKLKEETEELLSATTLEEIKKEMADVLEVLDALAKKSGFEIEEVERLRLKKQEERGGFSKGLFVEWVGIKPSSSSSSPSPSPTLQYYLSQPERYPEIQPTVVDESYR